MAIINFGSVNIDHVYQVDRFVQPGETIASTNYQQLLGGKGANQSIALAAAGAESAGCGAAAAASCGITNRAAAISCCIADDPADSWKHYAADAECASGV